MNNQPLILCIETSGNVCSVALGQGSDIVASEANCDGKHAENLSTMIDNILKTAAVKYSDLDAAAVSMGPGSYTGLRIGTATAKGICYGADKPLIAVDSLKALANLSRRNDPSALYCPMIDARRTEVYTAVFDCNLDEILPVEAKIVAEDSFADLLETKRMFFFGSGAEKCKRIIKHPNAVFTQVENRAEGMIRLAYEAYIRGKFENTAYFEPFYLKDYVVTQSKSFTNR